MKKTKSYEASSLYKKLCEYSKTDNYPWHMPGHKRRLVEFVNPFSIDITEIHGFDDLHHPEEILKEEMEAAADFYGSLKTYFLVNGSSCGILSAICAVTKPGDRILMARNCHKSAYHAVLLQQLEVEWIYPEINEAGFYEAVDCADIESGLCKNDDIKAVVIVSPGYEGVVSDIRKIAEISHQYGCALIVDEAHGAHFPYGKEGYFPESAIYKGADIVIQSLHKTLPSLTQTAVLHIGKNSGSYVSAERVQKYLGIYQSSSPSYVFLSSIDNCIRLMSGEAGKNLMKEYSIRLQKYRGFLKENFKNLTLYDPDKTETLFDYDRSKFVIYHKNGSIGDYMAYVLREKYHIETEMNTDKYVILMSSPADTEEGFSSMANALIEIDKNIDSHLKEDEDYMCYLPDNHSVFTISEAFSKDLKKVSLCESEGLVSGDFVYIYPPGIPLLVPGEVIQKCHIDIIKRYLEHDLCVYGIYNETDIMISVIIDIFSLV